jgi:DNA-binding NtrC family response regulator
MPPNILLVEDHPEIRDTIRSVLHSNNCNYNVSYADNGTSAIEACAKERPDLVLLNYIFPDAPNRPPVEIGLMLLGLIKRQWPTTEVIMITGSANLEVAFQAGRLGAFAFVNKPFEFEKLLEILRNALENKASSRKILPFAEIMANNESS